MADYEYRIEEADDECTVWRYMSLPKLLHIASTNQLYFCQTRCLGDPYEGSLAAYLIHKFPDLVPGKEETPAQHFVARAQFTTYVSCWCQQDGENASLWRTYSGPDGGVAVKTKLSKLLAALDQELKVYAGKVEYIDHFSSDQVQTTNPILHKRKEYGDEREVRLVLPMGAIRQMSVEELAALPTHHYRDFKFESGIEEIVLSPSTPVFIADALRASLSKICPKVRVVDSCMTQLPTHLYRAEASVVVREDPESVILTQVKYPENIDTVMSPPDF